MGEVRILVDGVLACWDREAERWTRLPAGLARLFEGLAPQLDEWETFWGLSADAEAVIDARDLGFDGAAPRHADRCFRSRRWRLLHDGEPPAPETTPSGYSVHRFDDGWVLQDDLLNRPALLIVAPKTAVYPS